MQEINIEGNEIIEWLQQRNKVKADWIQKLALIKIKKNEVLNNLKFASIAEIADTLNKEKREKEIELNYCDLLDIQDKLLKSKEAEGRSVFGNYTSQNIKSLQALIKIYQKDNFHIISIAQEMSQIITFDLVAAKKNSKNYENQIEDMKNKIDLFKASIKNARHEIVVLAKKYSSDFQIEESNAENIDFTQLINRYVNNISKKIRTILDILSTIDVEKMCKYYTRFAKVNSDNIFDEDYFELIIWIKRNGDTMMTDLHAGKITCALEFDEFYDEILKQKGYNQTDDKSKQEYCEFIRRS